jgi:dephospho-CoA kinase
MIIIVFGLAASGKTYVAKLIAEYLGFYHEDADQWISDEMKQYIEQKLIITDEIREKFTDNIINNIEIIRKKHDNIVLSQALYRQKNRQKIKEHFFDQELKFVQVTATYATIMRRLSKRKDGIDEEYAINMSKNFQAEENQAFILNNDLDGKEAALLQIKKVFNQ